jgi:hypothetical protein
VSQVNFFMLGDDEAELFAMLAQRGDVLFLPGRHFASARPRPLQQVPARPRELTLVNALLTPEPRCQVRGEDALLGRYLFDMYEDPHVELDRCRRRGQILHDGRLYWKAGRIRPRELDRPFARWAAALARWITTRYRRIDAGWWVGPQAEAWSRKGGKLALGGSLAAQVSLAR